MNILITKGQRSMSFVSFMIDRLSDDWVPLYTLIGPELVIAEKLKKAGVVDDCTGEVERDISGQPVMGPGIYLKHEFDYDGSPLGDLYGWDTDANIVHLDQFVHKLWGAAIEATRRRNDEIEAFGNTGHASHEPTRDMAKFPRTWCGMKFEIQVETLKLHENDETLFNLWRKH